MLVAALPTTNSAMIFAMQSDDLSQQEKVIIREQVDPQLARATFAPGCFWCMEAFFQETAGVASVINGYAGGPEYNPTYEDMYTHKTGHRESVMVFYNPKKISYTELLEIFWRNIDPTDPDGQFYDRGHEYTTAIFYETLEQQAQAQVSKQKLAESGIFDKPIVTEILPFTTFYEAEEYHQDFYLKSPLRYQSYKGAREGLKERIWREIQKGSK